MAPPGTIATCRRRSGRSKATALPSSSTESAGRTVTRGKQVPTGRRLPRCVISRHELRPLIFPRPEVSTNPGRFIPLRWLSERELCPKHDSLARAAASPRLCVPHAAQQQPLGGFGDRHSATTTATVSRQDADMLRAPRTSSTIRLATTLTSRTSPTTRVWTRPAAKAAEAAPAQTFQGYDDHDGP